MSSDTSISLSVVVPVHKVQGYLRQCLESILAPDAPGLEVIAVNDCSPDGCGAILDEFAERDPRVRVRHLTENVGLGEARNVGLDMATGDYVWFFDSDDYATEGAVRAVMDRLEETRPDVLLFDYARSYWNGKVKRSIINHLFREPPAPDVFRPEERLSVLELMMTAWNRAVRREYLLELGLRFSKGYYEDLNVTYPLLMAAERISLLDRTCYIYRQRRRGAITKTAGSKHFDAFAQYDRVFGFMDAMGERAAPFRPLMFNRAIWHLMVVLDKGDRVEHSERERYFRELSQLFKRYKPDDYQAPDDPHVARKHRHIEKGDFGGYNRTVFANRTKRKAKQKLRKARKNQRRLSKALKTRIKLVQYRTQLRRPIDEKLAVYGAYWYRGYACNPAAIYEAARELAPDIKGVWVVKPNGVDTIPKGVNHVVAGTPEYFRVMARAKYFVNNVNFPDEIVKRRGQVHVMTQHGTPLKKMGLEQMDYPVSSIDMDFTALLKRSDRWDFLLSSNPLSTEAWDRDFPCNYEMLEIGYPRNDRLVTATDEERVRLRAELGVPEGKTAILYAPTHRDYQARYTPMFDIGRFLRELGDDYVLLLRAHYYYKLRDLVRDMNWPEDRLIDVSAHPSVESLAIASDALLSDYSSIMFDYANLDRPIVLYVNDLETYRRTRGMNFDPMTTSPGVVASTEAELIDAFASRSAWGDPAAKARSDFRAKFCPWDDGQAAERAVRRVFLGEQVANPPS